MPEFYPCSPFQTDILTLGDAPVVYSPMFTYHGFRFIEIDGLDVASLDMVEGVFIHLDLDQLGFFECSNPDLNDLFRIGVNACYSNMHYILTDCPTREKLGWLNDARASAEQLLMNFDITPFFRKWYRDICESIRKMDGAIAGIAPTSGCLFDDFTGPICTSALHEIAYKTILHWGRFVVAAGSTGHAMSPRIHKYPADRRRPHRLRSLRLGRPLFRGLQPPSAYACNADRHRIVV